MSKHKSQSPVPMATVDSPKESVKLPSRGKVYPKDSALHSKSIEIYHLTTRGEDILTSRNLLKKGIVLDKLIQSAVVDRSIDIDDMLIGDKNTIMVAYRITGYGPEYKIEVECPSCEKKSPHVFDLSKMEVLGLGSNPISDGQNMFEFDLPVSKRKVCFKLLTGEDDRSITEIIESGKKVSEIETNITTRLFHQILSIDGEKDKSKIRTFVDTMKAGDSLALRDYMSDIEPGIEMMGTFDCRFCGNVEEIDCPMGLEFFWPGWRRKRRRKR